MNQALQSAFQATAAWWSQAEFNSIFGLLYLRFSPFKILLELILVKNSFIDLCWRANSSITSTSPNTFGLRLTGGEKFPVLKGPSTMVQPLKLEVFSKWKSASNATGVVLHFYVNDAQQQYAVGNPLKWVTRLSNASAVISPDLSIRFDDPPAVRRVNTRNNRIAAARWEEHGLQVIPNVRWNDASDYDFCFDGLPQKSQLAVSSVTMLKDKTDRKNLVWGFQEMLERLEPVHVIWHGRIPNGLPMSCFAKTEIAVFPCRIDNVYNKVRFNGGR